jgi:anti-anti-sigma factor
MAKQHDGNRVVLEGEWDLARKEELEELLGRLSLDGDATIDMRGCTYADSTVLAALAAIRAKFADKQVTLLGPSRQLVRVLKIANFDRLFRILDGD